MNIALLTKIGASALLLSALSFSAQSEVINTDWESTGDNKVITDTTTGLEFLNLTETLGMSIGSVKALLNTTFSGWRISTGAEASSMLANLLASSTGFLDYNPGGVASYKKIVDTDTMDAFKITGGSSLNQAYGMSTSGNKVFMYGFSYSESVNSTNLYSNYGPRDDAWSNPSYSTWLVREISTDIVDEDAAVNDVSTPFALSSLALLGFGAFRRKRSN